MLPIKPTPEQFAKIKSTEIRISNFATKLHEKTGLPYADCLLILKTFCGMISEELIQGNVVVLPTVGKFSPWAGLSNGYNYMEKKVTERLFFRLKWQRPQSLFLKMKYNLRAKMGIPILPKDKWMITEMKKTKEDAAPRRKKRINNMQTPSGVVSQSDLLDILKKEQNEN